MTDKLGFIYDPIFLEHNPGDYHPENAQRLIAILTILQKKPFWKKLHHYKPPEISRNLLKLAHSSDLIDFNLSQAGKQRVLLDSGDTVLSEK